ncbi:unnamed protein product [Orchesella dallaii]|uniref:Enhancer of rudimentary homolog n=1 Tax=Orchesella dallaii TaxID=48710 RepID=A0ABP1PY24_9HEXA
MSYEAVYHHTILMIQPLADPMSRRYWPYSSLECCMEGLCRIFEQYLKVRTGDESNVVTVRYEIVDILNFIDTLPDLACMVKRHTDGHFVPFPKDWIKEKVYLHLYHQAHKKN